MVSIKLKFRPSTIEGKVGSLYYQVIYMRKVRQVSTNFRITRSEWDSELEDLIIKDDDSSRANYLQYVQNHIEYDKKCFKRIVKKLTISDSPFTVDTIVDEFHKQSFEITLFSYMEKMIAKLWRQGQHRTSETYQATLNSFRKFREGVDVCFDDIDSEMLISYEYHLRAKELAPNTISFYMKRLRAVYNNAVEDGYVENKNPFKKVFTSSEKTVKRAIQLKFVRKLKDLDLSYSPSKSFARDMFLFSFYTRGMAFTSNTRKQYHNALTLINHNLKAIGKELGLTLPLTMYVARHSWASIARDEGIPISVISEGMGHDSESTTQIYLASLETQVIDNANKKILKLL